MDTGAKHSHRSLCVEPANKRGGEKERKKRKVRERARKKGKLEPVTRAARREKKNNSHMEAKEDILARKSVHVSIIISYFSSFVALT